MINYNYVTLDAVFNYEIEDKLSRSVLLLTRRVYGHYCHTTIELTTVWMG
jgi:hypothetical protein